jgi:hypothetical protein
VVEAVFKYWRMYIRRVHVLFDVFRQVSQSGGV